MPELKPFGDDLRLLDGPEVSFYRFRYPTRMPIVRLDDGALWLWSPIRLDDEMRAGVDSRAGADSDEGAAVLRRSLRWLWPSHATEVATRG